MNEISQPAEAYLLLEDGSFFKGISFGKKGVAGGELCFNTGMTGYQEVFTDPSYAGQMLIMNNCYIGNYGVNDVDVESDKVQIKGLICKNISDRFSRMTATGSIEKYLLDHNIIAIHGVDTRALVQHIRTKGAMNCIVSTETSDPAALAAQLKNIPNMKGLDLATDISTKTTYNFGNPDASMRVSVLDFGIKRNMLQCLSDLDIYLKVFPSKTTLEELKTFNPDGIFVSNGPGDPAVMDYAVETVRQIIHSGIPMFGICLGHQLLAQANGIATFKMHHGHRGLNHPVLNLITGKGEITTQNHGFGIDLEGAKNNPDVEITHINLNDQSVEGIRMKHQPAFSVQYHPESTPGTHDSRYLFQEFIDSIKTAKK
jgi:carbamoyl-phosphate synthase small subunit